MQYDFRKLNIVTCTWYLKSHCISAKNNEWPRKLCNIKMYGRREVVYKHLLFKANTAYFSICADENDAIVNE